MADIVILKKWRDRHPERVPVRLDKHPAAELLLFQGVRYERLEDMTHRSMDEMTLRLDTH